MEVLVILAGFTAMLLALLWSGRAERNGDAAAHSGLFGYSDARIQKLEKGSVRHDKRGGRRGR